MHIIILLSDSDTLSPESIDLGYVPPGTISDNLKVDFTTLTDIDLSDSNFVLDVGKLRHLCGIDGAHIIVYVDPANRVDETDETNNMASAPVSLDNCFGKVQGKAVQSLVLEIISLS